DVRLVDVVDPFAKVCDSNARTVALPWEIKFQDAGSPHLCQFVAKVERIRTMLIDNELVAEVCLGNVLQDEHRLLNVRFSAPASSLAQPLYQICYKRAARTV